mmetsp:Transcript_31533/g.33870  ORF Transcript_31533/g.33870 Transcript_31533/m.33870 type:complete len:242 (+) Transcript_31533:63-788(+)
MTEEESKQDEQDDDDLQNLYSLLNLNKDATDDEVKKAYKTLSSSFHPDKVRLQTPPSSTRTQTQTQTRQPSQQPSSLLPQLSYLMREGDDVDVNAFNDDSKTTTTTTAPSTSIPTSTRTRTDTMGSSINFNNYVDEKMIEDLQNQHLQMMQMQLQQQQQSSYSVTIPQPQVLQPSATAATIIAVATNSDTMVGIYDQLHDDLTYLNIQLLRSKVSFMYRLLPKNKKQHIERFVNLLIKFIL